MRTRKKISQIKRTVAVADSSQALADLTANPDSVAILGSVTQISPWQITVEKTSFIISSKTSIKDSDGNELKLSDLALKTKVNVVGLQDKNNSNLIAQQILVTAAADAASVDAGAASGTEPQVKGDSTASSSTGTDVTIKKPIIEEKKI